MVEASSESTSSSPSALFVDSYIRDINKEIKKVNWIIDEIDTEGGRRLENVDRDLVFLRKEFKWPVKHSENLVMGLMAKLEIKMEKLKLKVVKLEAAKKPGSSSHHEEGK